jgi:3-oxoacyl-[acyl-carrier protein] reductase
MNRSKYKKTILITGGTGGIGSALVERLMTSPKEWNIVITGRKNSTRLSSIKNRFGLKLAYEWDATSKSEMQIIMHNIAKEYGGIDALVNCVAVTLSDRFENITEERALEEYRINVLGTIFAIQATIPYMQKNEKGGKIINTSSIRGFNNTSSARSVTYSMTKASIANLTASLAREYSPLIEINAIAPGFTRTSMADRWAKTTWDNATKNNYFKRPAEPIEIANHIAFLLSENCTYMVGQTILVDGGFTLYDK